MKLSDKQIAQARSKMKTSVTASMLSQAAVDERAKEDLMLYITNTVELYPMKESIIQNMAKKIEKGTYDPELAVKGWMNWVDLGAKQYIQEFNVPGNEPRLFPRELRLAVARDIAEEEADKIKSGEYKKEAAPAAPAAPLDK